MWQALWPFMCVPENLFMRVTAQEFNHTKKYGPHGELFFLLMRKERDRPDRSSATQTREHLEPFFLHPAGCTAFRRR